MHLAKSFYFVYFAAAACLLPFLTLYYQDLGLSGQQIGTLTGIVPLITIVASSAWGAIADITQKHRPIILVGIVGVCISMVAMSQANSFALLLPIVCAYALFVAPIIPLIDNAVMSGLGSEKANYGRVRVWGSYGWGVAALLIGLLIEQQGFSVTFICFLLLMTSLLAVALRLPMPTAVANQQTATHGLWQLMSNGRWLIFLLVSLIHGMSMTGIFANYLFLHLNDMGSSDVIISWTLVIATLSEIPVFFYARHLLKRWGAPFVIMLALATTVLRAFAYAFMTAPWQVLFISLLHGPTFGAMWVAGVAYVDELAGERLGATAQSVFSSAVYGGGTAVGALLGGYLYDTVGVITAFQFAGWACLVALFIFWAMNQFFPAPLAQTAPNIATDLPVE